MHRRSRVRRRAVAPTSRTQHRNRGRRDSNIYFTLLRPDVNVVISWSPRITTSAEERTREKNNAKDDPWLAWLDSDCRVYDKCSHGGRAPHPTPQNIREPKGSECPWLGKSECPCLGKSDCRLAERSESLWPGYPLAVVGYSTRRYAPELQPPLGDVASKCLVLAGLTAGSAPQTLG